MTDSTTLSVWKECEQHRPRFLKSPCAYEDGVALRGCDIVAAWSRWAAESIIADHGVNADRVHVVPPGVEVPRENPRSARRRTLPPDPVSLAFIGNDFERKGGPRLVRWHQERWSHRAELHIFSREAVPDPAAKNIIWHGAVENAPLVRDWLPTMDIFVMPTREDVAGVVVAEAQAAGLPVVSSRMAGLPSLMQDGVTGFLADHREDAGYVAGVERWLDDRALLERMGHAAFEFASTSLDTVKVHGAWMDRVVDLARRQPW